MYVAVTRARRAAALSYAAFRMVAGITQRQTVSRFVGEVPDECAEWAGAIGPRGWRDRPNDDYQDDVYDAESVSDEACQDDDQDHCQDDGEVDYDLGEEGEALRVGMQVVHPVFGHGELQRITGEGFRMKVVVRFRDGREKTLVPEYCQLQVVPGGEAI